MISSLCNVTMSTVRNYEMYSYVNILKLKLLKSKSKSNVTELIRGLLGGLLGKGVD